MTTLSTKFVVCKVLDCDGLGLLLVQVDKENLIEFSFVYYTLLIYVSVFTLIYKVPYISLESFPLMRLLAT